MVTGVIATPFTLMSKLWADFEENYVIIYDYDIYLHLIQVNSLCYSNNKLVITK